MNLKTKLLSNSNSYKFYKENFESISEENQSLKKEIESLKKENKKLNEKANSSLGEKYTEIYKSKGHLCNQEYLDYYLDDNFEDILKNVTKTLDSKNRKYYKYLFLRSLFVNLIKQDTLYTENEINEQKRFNKFKNHSIKDNKIGQFKFEGEYNIHPFVDLGLDEDSLEFLKNKDIIDAGAFTGDTSLPLSEITTGTVYAFEPFKESYELLVKNIENNNISNIMPVNKSLGNINGERTLYIGENIQGITSQKNSKTWNEKITVQESTIDKFVEENKLDVGYIVVDVEGAEFDLLNGAINTIKTQKPILNISIYHSITDFFNIIPWIDNLNLGYEFKIITEGPWTFLTDTCVQCIVRENL